jgi:stage III sporulation protein AH
MLEDVLNNPNSSPEAKEEAENLLFDLITVMEQELLVENMIKAQGYDEAIFFYRNRVATVMIKQKELNDREFIQITDTVAGVIGIEREDVQVITRP